MTLPFSRKFNHILVRPYRWIVAVMVFAISIVGLFFALLSGVGSASPLSAGPTSPIPTPPPLPDLVIQRLEVDRSVPRHWQTRVVTVTVANVGETGTPNNFLLGVYEDRQPSGSGCNDFGWAYSVIPSLATDETYTTTFTHPGFDGAGTHTLAAHVDFGCAVTESREDNNLASPVVLELTSGRIHLPLVIQGGVTP